MTSCADHVSRRSDARGGGPAAAHEAVATAQAAVGDVAVEPSCPCRGNGALERVVVELDPRHGLAHLERVVSLLRGRNHPVAGLSTDLRGESARVAVWGHDLHAGDPDALVLRRLHRLPGVLAAYIGPTQA